MEMNKRQYAAIAAFMRRPRQSNGACGTDKIAVRTSSWLADELWRVTAVYTG
jgi:hypothetical protein